MVLGLSGLPGFTELASARNDLFKTSHNWNQDPNPPSLVDQAASWLGHKVLTVVTVPADIIEAGLCTAGFITAACTLGTIKVAIFAATLGNVKPDFPTGCLWLGERALHGVADIGLTALELAYDLGNIGYQGYRAARWVAGKLHLGNLFNAIFDEIARVFKFIGDRIGKGIDKASEVEPSMDLGTPFPLNLLDDLTKAHRIDFGSNNRPLSDIFMHYVLSAVNIPLNAATAVVTAGASVVLCSAFVAKVLLYSTTNINIPVPTFAGQALSASVSTAYNAFVDASNDVADVFVLVYKTSEAIGFNQVVATAVRVVLYIPEAVFA